MSTSPTTPPSEKETGRLEAFSDGVLAVAITLLALNISVPGRESGRAWHGLTAALAGQWPVYLAYLLSFLTILIMWVNHHNMFKLIERVDHLFLLLNGALLLVITLFPFATILLADYIEQPDKKTAQIIYAGISLIMALVFNTLWRYASRQGGLLSAAADQKQVQAITKRFRFGPLLYLATFVLAFISAEVSLAACIGLAIFFAIPSDLLQRQRA
ncbi:MAG: TMEM175 family protein [Chloroflexota bacterium]